MSLIPEDGTIVVDANTFATLQECKDFAALRGLTLPADAEVEALLVLAADYLSALEEEFQGSRVDAAQELPWPRSGVIIYGEDVAEDSIPKILKQAQCQLAFDASENDLQATGSGRVILEEGVGPLRTKFDTDGASNPQVNPTAALKILAPLLDANSNVGGGNINIPVGR